jgi:hypothetical protein
MNWIQRILVLLVTVPAVIYLGDWAVVKVRGTPTSQVTIKQYLAIPQKGNKLQYVPADPAIEECVEALFPHGGDRPCWYVHGHTRRQIDM